MITFIRGLPGSGKSTLARYLADTYGMIHLESDQYFIRNGVYRYSKQHIAEAHALCRNTMYEYAKAGADVVVSNTFTQRRELIDYMDSLPPNTTAEVIACWASGDSIHAVPDDVIARMRARWEDWWGEMLYDFREPDATDIASFLFAP